MLPDAQHYISFTQTCDWYYSHLCHLLCTDHLQMQAVLQLHTCCFHSRIPIKNCGFRFAHLVCQYCFVSPKPAWQTDRLEGCKQVQNCSFWLDVYTAVSHTLQFKHSVHVWMTCDGNMSFSRCFRKFACF